jgi:PAS domain S-box-containing protein
MPTTEKNVVPRKTEMSSLYRRALRAFRKIADIAEGSRNREEILKTSLKCLLEMLDVEVGGFCLPEEDRPRWRGCKSTSTEILEGFFNTPVGERLLKEVLSRGGVTVISEPDPFLSSEGFGSLIVSCVASGEEVFGVVAILTPEENRISPEERDLVESFSEAVGACLKNNKLLSRLRKSELTYRVLVENVDEILLQLDTRGNLTFLSGKIFDSIGYQPHELLGCNFQQLIHPEDLAIPVAAFGDGLQGGSGVTSGFYRVKHKEGGYRWHFSSYTSLKDEGGRVTGGIAVSRDVTEEVETREKLQISEIRSKEIFETIQEGIVATDLKGKIVDLNQVALRSLELEPEETEGQSFYNFFSPEDSGKIEESRIAVLKYERISNREFTFVSRRGRSFPVEMNVSLLRSQSGQPQGFLWVGRDVSERRKLERKLRESEEKYRNVFNTFPASLFLLDTKGRVVDVNDWHVKHSGPRGISREDLLGTDFPGYLSDARVEVGRRLSELLSGRPFESRNINMAFGPGEIEAVLDIIGVPRYSLEGEVMGALLVCLDVSQRRELERKSIEAKRLEAVRDLAGAIAHEFSQPIQGLLLLGEMSSLGEVNHKHWAQVLELTERLRDLVQRLKQITSVRTKAYLQDRILDFHGSSESSERAS